MPYFVQFYAEIYDKLHVWASENDERPTYFIFSLEFIEESQFNFCKNNQFKNLHKLIDENIFPIGTYIKNTIHCQRDGGLPMDVYVVHISKLFTVPGSIKEKK